MPQPAVLELLLRLELIDEHQQEAVMSRTPDGGGARSLQTIAELGYATEAALAKALAAELGLPRVDLQANEPEPDAVALLDEKTCRDRMVLPCALRDHGELLWLAMADPTDAEALELVRRKAHKRVRAAVATPGEIARAAALLHGSFAPSTGPQALARPASAETDEIETEGPSAPSPARASERLSEEQLALVEAVRGSLERGNRVLDALVELCVEKGVLAAGEIPGRRR